MEPARSTPPWRREPARALVVLPAFDEEANLGPLLEAIDQSLAEAGVTYEVIVVDDGSADGTLAVARAYAEQMPVRVERHERNQGLGATLRDGLRAAVSRASDRDVVVVMDADNSHPPSLVPAMLRAVDEGADVVIASRYRPGAAVRGVPRHRQALSAAARWLFTLLFAVSGVRDYTCGYRAYRASTLRRAFERHGSAFVDQEGFQCSVDILLKLHALGAIFREVPLILRYDRKGGASKMRVARTVRDTLALVLRRRLRLET